MGRIGVLLSGLSPRETDAGEAVFEALRVRGHDAVKIFVDRDLDLALRAGAVDSAFVALPGREEEGLVKGLLELRGVPYTGSSPLSSQLARDKLKAKELFRLHNLPTPAYYLHRRGEGSIEHQHGSFGFPVVVKPRAAGASLAVARAEDLDELEAAVDEALRFDDHVLVERFADGREVHVVLAGGRVLGAAEVQPVRPIFDFATRTGAAPHSLFVPPRLGPERLRGVTTLAERAARALEVSGLVEVDLIVSPRGNELLLEVDPSPSLLPRGLAARTAAAHGIEYGALVELILGEAGLHGRRRAGALEPASSIPVERRLASEPH